MSDNLSDALTELEYELSQLRIENESLRATVNAQVREISMQRDLNARLSHERDRNLIKLTELRSLLSVTSSGLVEGLKRMQQLDDERRNIPDADAVPIKPERPDAATSVAELLPYPNYSGGRGKD